MGYCQTGSRFRVYKFSTAVFLISTLILAKIDHDINRDYTIMTWVAQTINLDYKAQRALTIKYKEQCGQAHIS